MNNLYNEANNWINKNLLEDSNNMNVIGIYAGRFQPFHKNHFLAWEWLSNKFKNSFIGTSNITGPKSPFSFNDKKYIMTTAFNIPSSKIVQIKNPYKAEEIVSKFDPKKTAIVFGVGKKDASRLGGKYFREYKDGMKLLPYTEAGYYVIIPHFSFSFNNKLIDGTLVRSIFSSNNIEEKKKLFNVLYGKFNKSVFDLLIKKINVNESINKFIKHALTESSVGNASMVDDGPATWYKNEFQWKRTLNKKINSWGYKILDYIVNGTDDLDNSTEYPSGPVDSVTYGPAGVGNTSTATNQTNLSGLLANKKWKAHIKHLINTLGYEFIKWDNPSLFITENKLLLKEGGAGGHMLHPFDDVDLRFEDLKTMITLGLQGKLETVIEKSDGINMFISITDRGVVAARNKAHLKNWGKEALDINGMKQMFAGRGDIADAFVFAITDLSNALPSSLIKDLENGKYWINLEIIYPATTNVIPYGLNLLSFHNIVEVDENGNTVGVLKNSYSKLQSIINKVNKDVTKHFDIDIDKIIKIKPTVDYSKKVSYYINKLNALRNKYKLGWSDRLMKYHFASWEEIINAKEKELNYTLNSKAKNALLDRWAYDNKSIPITKFKDFIDNDKMLTWIKQFDKKDFKAQVKKNFEPFESIILEWGMELLQNMESYLAPNPSQSVDILKKEIDKTMAILKNSSDVKDMNKINTLIKKIESLGGFGSVLPTEGLTFIYNNKLYKITGVFAPLNQLLGLIKFGN